MTTDPKALADEITSTLASWRTRPRADDEGKAMVGLTESQWRTVEAALRAPSSAEAAAEARDEAGFLGPVADCIRWLAEENAALRALSPDPGSAPVEGWKEGAEAMRYRAAEVISARYDGYKRHSPECKDALIALSHAERDVLSLPLPPPPAEPSRDTQEGERG